MLRSPTSWLIVAVLAIVQIALGRIMLLQMIGAGLLLLCLWGILMPHIGFGDSVDGIRLTGSAKAWVLVPSAAVAMSLVAYAPDIVCAKKRYRHECVPPDQPSLKKTP